MKEANCRIRSCVHHKLTISKNKENGVCSAKSRWWLSYYRSRKEAEMDSVYRGGTFLKSKGSIFRVFIALTLIFSYVENTDTDSIQRFAWNTRVKLWCSESCAVCSRFIYKMSQRACSLAVVRVILSVFVGNLFSIVCMVVGRLLSRQWWSF